MTNSFIIDYQLYDSFDIDSLRKKLILPLQKEGIFLTCAFCEDSLFDGFTSVNLIEEIKLSKEQILFFLSDIKFRIKLYTLCQNCIKSSSELNYIKEFFSSLLKKAIELRVSDIHLESLEDSFVIRFRIDGRLKLFYTFDKAFQRVISSYIKLLAKLDITQNRVALDGSYSFFVEDKKYDFRVSTLPTIYGESIVLRVLDSSSISKDIFQLGFSKHCQKYIEEIKSLNSGLVLIAGPTGSGKSTTLYSIIKDLNKEDRKIVTVEDPVEYKLHQVQQVEVNDELNVGFKEILKNILRQDPDIILIGEIRDANSLQIALQASLTGHLVLASIHANSAIETLSRLYDLKCDNYLLSLTLKYIISQRLVLNICKNCQKQGCEICNFSGFYSRSSIAEVLKIDEKIASSILNRSSIKEYLKTIDFKTILDDGKEKVKEGITTLEEVYNVINT